MCAVWLLQEADALQVSTLLRERYSRVYPTKTAGIFLARLARKGFLDHRTVNPVGPGRPAHVYFPAVTKDDALRRQFQKFLSDYALEAPDLETLEALLLAAAHAMRE